MSDMRLAIYYFTEVVSGMVLNVLLVIGGAGLLGLAEWGRRLSIGVAWAKILRWVAMTVVTMVVIVPITTEKMDKMFTQIQAQARANSGGATRCDADGGPRADDGGHERGRRRFQCPDRLDLPGDLALVSDSTPDPRGVLAER